VYRTPAHREGRGVVEIPGGIVYGSKGYVGPDTRGVLTDASSVWSPEERTVLAGSAQALACGLEELDGTSMCVWAGNAWGNYAHGLLQGVPRIDLLRRGFALDADRYLLDEKSARPIFEALDILGIPADKLQLIPREHSPAYRCATLRAATSPPFTDAWPAAFLHELFLPDPPTTAPSRRIYIRREGPRRAVLNEEEVIEVLGSAGFEILSMEGPTVREQAAVFADAEAIVSAHGASLANLVFARRGATVIELMGRNAASAVYAEMSWLHGLDYDMVMGVEPAPPDRWWTWQMLADTIVDVPALRRCLERHGLA
jgi:capsular polysaccharide biosynthesis protein